ncbi:nucleoside-diphosphate kinase [Mycobacteroides abscessus]
MGNTSHTVLVIKPDGLRSDEARELVWRLLADSGLQVVDRYCTRFTEADVLDIWPRFAQRKYLITASLLRVYMTDGSSEVIILYGDDAIRKCRYIRSVVREQFGDSAVANCIHTAADEEEARWNVEKLFGGGRPASSFLRPNVLDNITGLWGRLAELETTDLEGAVQECWRRKKAYGWAAVWPRVDGTGQHAAYLRPGDPNTIDYGISVLFELALHGSAISCLGAYLEAEILGEAVIATGDELDMHSLANSILGLGLRSEARETIQQ